MSGEPQSLEVRMYEAVGTDQVDAVAGILDENPGLLTAVLQNGTTWLHVAARRGQNIVRYLVDSGLDVNARDGTGATALTRAAHSANLAAMRSLIEGGATIDPRAFIGGISSGDLQAVGLLIENGADVNAIHYMKNSGRNVSMLDFADSLSKDDIAEFLKSKGARRMSETCWQGVATTTSPLVQHLENHWGRVHPQSLTQIVGELQIRVVAPADDDDCFTLATDGVRCLGSDEMRPVELMVQLPAQWPVFSDDLKKPEFYWPIEWLLEVAAQIAAGNRYCEFETVANGEPAQPLGAKTQFVGFLLVKDEDTGLIEVDDGKDVELLELTPLYKEELVLARKRGWQALVKRFAKHDIPSHIAPGRKNVGGGLFRRR